MNVSVAKVTASELPECLEVIHQSFRTVAEEFGLTQENCPKHTSFIPLYYLEAQMEWGWHMYALHSEDRVIGYMSLSKEDGDAYELHNLAVLPDYRHGGCGKLLLDHAKEVVKSLGGKVIKIGIMEENTVLKQWYIANGFVPTGSKKFDHLPFLCGYLEWRMEERKMAQQDLHDFDDVAENYDLYLDVMYSEVDAHAGFQEFYLDFAREYGKDGVIDIACGTGAVLLYLAEHGIYADGTDLSEAMCRVAEEKAKAKGFDLNIFPANMTEFKSERKYSCAIIARSGFMHLTTPELQRAALLNIRENLTDGGMLTFNTFDPHPYFQAQQMNTKDTDYSFRLEYTNKQGNREKIYNAISYDPHTQVMSGNWKFETLDENGEVVAERIRPVKMRQTYRQEMKYLLELTGYEIVNVYGGYYKESGDASAKNVIWCVRKK